MHSAAVRSLLPGLALIRVGIRVPTPEQVM